MKKLIFLFLVIFIVGCSGSFVDDNTVVIKNEIKEEYYGIVKNVLFVSVGEYRTEYIVELQNGDTVVIRCRLNFNGIESAPYTGAYIFKYKNKDEDKVGFFVKNRK